MSLQNNKKLSIKSLLSIVGIAGASILMSLPVLAQATPDNSGSTNQTQTTTTERQPTDDRAAPGENSNMQTQPSNNGMSTTGTQQMNNSGSTTEMQQYNRRSTTTGQQVNTDTPATGTQQTPMNNTGSPMGTQQMNTGGTTTGTTQQTTDQGVRALW